MEHAIFEINEWFEKGKSISCASNANTMPFSTECFPISKPKNRNSLVYRLRNNWYGFVSIHVTQSFLNIQHGLHHRSTDLCTYFLIGIVIVIKPFPLCRTHSHSPCCLVRAWFSNFHIINVQCNKYTKTTIHTLCWTHTHHSSYAPTVSNKLFAVVLGTNSMQSSHSCKHSFHFNDSNLSLNGNSWLEKQTYICLYRSLCVGGWVCARYVVLMGTHKQWWKIWLSGKEEERESKVFTENEGTHSGYFRISHSSLLISQIDVTVFCLGTPTASLT